MQTLTEAGGSPRPLLHTDPELKWVRLPGGVAPRALAVINRRHGDQYDHGEVADGDRDRRNRDQSQAAGDDSRKGEMEAAVLHKIGWLIVFSDT